MGKRAAVLKTAAFFYPIKAFHCQSRLCFSIIQMNPGIQTMLSQLLEKLAEEITFTSAPQWKGEEECHFQIFPEVEIYLQTLKPKGIFISSILSPVPTLKKEEIFLRLMEANLLGQGTGGGVISLDTQENFLTLSLDLPYEMDYVKFKEQIEDFVNYLSYWREEIKKLEQPSIL